MGTREKVNRRKRVSCNREFFTKDSPELYYFVGFLFGDGWVEYNGMDSWCRVRLSTTDKSIIDLFQSWVKTTQKIGERVPRVGMKMEYRISIVDEIAVDKLVSCGLVIRKSINGAIPIIPKQYFWPFFCGLIDSDGSISIDKRFNAVFIRCYGHRLLMDWISGVLINEGLFHRRAVDKSGLCEVRIARREYIKRVWKVVKEFNFVLERKWKILSGWVNGFEKEGGIWIPKKK